MFSFIPKAQEKDAVSIKQKTISEARYLKSIYKTDKAISLLSGLLRPDCFDEELLSELADCHMQAGDYESAASTYRMLQLHAPDNILYSIKLMGIYYRLKDYPSSAEYGKSIIRKDTIPAIISMTGDSFNMMDKADSALAYYELYLRVGKANPAVVSKAATFYGRAINAFTGF